MTETITAAGVFTGFFMLLACGFAAAGLDFDADQLKLCAIGELIGAVLCILSVVAAKL